MNKKILILLLFPIWAFAQNDTIKSNKDNWTESDFSFKKERIKQRPTLEKKNNIIKTSVFLYSLGYVNLSFEKKMSKRTSYRIGAGTILYDPLLKLRNNNQLSSSFISSDFRIYLGWKKANRGFYIAPHILGFVISSENDLSATIVELGTTQAVGTGLLFGNQWIANSFVFDLNLGYVAYESWSSWSYENADLKESKTNESFGLPNLNFSIGYAF
jgi:hypothetical protein